MTMSIGSGVVVDGLVSYYDFENKKSYQGTPTINLLPNTSLRNNASQWTFNDVTIKADNSLTSSLYGDNYIEVSGTGVSHHRASAATYPISGSVPYTFSFHMRRMVDGGAANDYRNTPFIQFLSASVVVDQTTSTSKYALSTGSWNRVSITHTSPSHSDQARPYSYATSTYNAKYYMCNFQFEKEQVLI